MLTRTKKDLLPPYFELHFPFFFSQVFRHERRQCSLQGKVPRLLPAQLKGHVSQGCDFRKQPVRGRAVGLCVKRKITATVFARYSFLLLPHRSNSCSNLACAIPEGGPPPGIAQSSRYNMRRQSTTEEILIARGFRRESTTEDIMRCRNFRRQSQVVTSSHSLPHLQTNEREERDICVQKVQKCIRNSGSRYNEEDERRRGIDKTFLLSAKRSNLARGKERKRVGWGRNGGSTKIRFFMNG